LGECLVWRVRTTGWFWLVKTKLELGLIFGSEFRTGTKVSIFSKTQNQTKPNLNWDPGFSKNWNWNQPQEF
jgi:hypothetical protein